MVSTSRTLAPERSSPKVRCSPSSSIFWQSTPVRSAGRPGPSAPPGAPNRSSCPVPCRCRSPCAATGGAPRTEGSTYGRASPPGDRDGSVTPHSSGHSARSRLGDVVFSRRLPMGSPVRATSPREGVGWSCSYAAKVAERSAAPATTEPSRKTEVSRRRRSAGASQQPPPPAHAGYRPRAAHVQVSAAGGGGWRGTSGSSSGSSSDRLVAQLPPPLHHHLDVDRRGHDRHRRAERRPQPVLLDPPVEVLEHRPYRRLGGELPTATPGRSPPPCAAPAPVAWRPTGPGPHVRHTT